MHLAPQKKLCHQLSGFIRLTRFLLSELTSLREKLVTVPEWCVLIEYCPC